jgi:hypothetical protein
MPAIRLKHTTARFLDQQGGYPVLEYFHKKPQAPPVIMITAKEGRPKDSGAEFFEKIGRFLRPKAM